MLPICQSSSYCLYCADNQIFLLMENSGWEHSCQDFCVLCWLHLHYLDKNVQANNNVPLFMVYWIDSILETVTLGTTERCWGSISQWCWLPDILVKKRKDTTLAHCASQALLVVLLLLPKLVCLLRNLECFQISLQSLSISLIDLSGSIKSPNLQRKRAHYNLNKKQKNQDIGSGFHHYLLLFEIW